MHLHSNFFQPLNLPSDIWT